MINSRRFIVPDIHGCSKTFIRLIFDVISIRRIDSLYILGDMIDRGPNSKEVIDTILRLQSAGYLVHVLRGNHEEMLLNACNSRNDFRIWMLNGGRFTLESFGVEDACEIQLLYLKFISNLPYYFVLDDFILVHAGLNMSIPEPFQDTESMLWDGRSPINSAQLGRMRIICGHTPVPRQRIKDSILEKRITLDNGCVYVNNPTLGSLTALELNSMEVYFQENLDY